MKNIFIMQKALFSTLLLFFVASQRSFVDTAPFANDSKSKEDNISTLDENVKELENLKNSFVKQSGETIAKMSQNVEAIYDKDRPKTKIKTELEVPSKGHQKTIDQTLPADEKKLVEARRSDANINGIGEENSVEKVQTSGSIQYSPLDVAKYIFWTGDEKGVTLAIKEFLREDLMTGEEALAFLQEIKYNLDKLKNHYTQIGLHFLQHKKKTDESPLQLKINPNIAVYDKPELRSNFNIKQLRKEMDAAKSTVRNRIDLPHGDKSAEDYDELLERLKMADYLYTEYSLEEIIYQLAKVMFTQSLTKGNAEAQQALQKFTNFLEAESEQGHISREIEKKVLDVLIASMSDTLNEHPELLASAQESMGPTATSNQGHNFIRKVLKSNPDETSSRDMYEYKGKAKNKLVEQKENNKLANFLQFDFSKYKMT